MKVHLLTKSISSPNIHSKNLGWENGSICYRNSITINNNKMDDNNIYKIEKIEGFSTNVFPELGASPSIGINYLHLEYNEQEKNHLWEPSKKPLNTSQTISNRANKPYLRSNLVKLNESKIEKNDSLPNISIVDLVGSHKNNLRNNNNNNSINNIKTSSDDLRSSTNNLRNGNNIKKSSDDLRNSTNNLRNSNNNIYNINNTKSSSDDLRNNTIEKNRSLSNLAKAKNITNNISFGVVLFDYEADCDSDLELVKGQIIIVVKKDQDGWCEGFHYKPVKSDKPGIFPHNYIEILSNNDPLLKSPSTQATSSLAKQLQLHKNQQLQQQSQQSQQAQQFPPQSPRLPAPKNQSITTSSIQSSISSLSNSTYNNNNNKSNSSISSLSNSLSISIPKQIKLSPIIQRVDENIPHIKVYIPPFMEFILVPYKVKDTLRDVLQKIIRNNSLLKDSLCQFKYPNDKQQQRYSPQQQPLQSQSLTLSHTIESLKDPDTFGVKLFISGYDYIEKVNNSLSSVKLLNQFYLNYNPQDCYWLQYDQTSIQIKKNPDGPPIRIIGLNFMDVEIVSCERHNSFSISTLFKEEFVFSSDMISIVKLWVDSIQQSCQFITYKYGPYYHSPLTPTSDHSHSSSSSSSSPFLMSSSDFDQIRSLRCNSKCADCSSVQPEWASLQFGIFLCDTCSDIHQEHLKNPDSLGVISALLDDSTIWSSYIQLFKKLGNINSNNYYESNIPVQFKKPQPTSSKLEKIQYFKFKYIDKLFIPN